MKTLLACSAAMTMLAAAPAVAQEQPKVPPAAAKPDAPDKMICEKELDTGSRLSSHKICHTRSQWEQLRRDDRETIERVQSQRAMRGDGS